MRRLLGFFNSLFVCSIDMPWKCSDPGVLAELLVGTLPTHAQIESCEKQNLANNFQAVRPVGS